jgi:hypothetical protein
MRAPVAFVVCFVLATACISPTDTGNACRADGDCALAQTCCLEVCAPRSEARADAGRRGDDAGAVDASVPDASTAGAGADAGPDAGFDAGLVDAGRPWVDRMHLVDISVPQDFGAACDGVTDDTTALQRALDEAPYNAVALVPGTRCVLTRPIHVRRPLTFFGDDSPSTGLVLRGDAGVWIDAQPARDGGSVTYAQGVTFYGFSVNGAGLASNGCAFRIDNTNGRDRWFIPELRLSSIVGDDLPCFLHDAHPLEASFNGFTELAPDGGVAYRGYGAHLYGDVRLSRVRLQRARGVQVELRAGWSYVFLQDLEIAAASNALIPAAVRLRGNAGGMVSQLTVRGGAGAAFDKGLIVSNAGAVWLLDIDVQDVRGAALALGNGVDVHGSVDAISLRGLTVRRAHQALAISRASRVLGMDVQALELRGPGLTLERSHDVTLSGVTFRGSVGPAVVSVESDATLLTWLDAESDGGVSVDVQGPGRLELWGPRLREATRAAGGGVVAEFQAGMQVPVPPMDASVQLTVASKDEHLRSLFDGGFRSLRALGAVGDGVHDDTSAFTRALAEGGAFVVPYTPRGYIVRSGLRVTRTLQLIAPVHAEREPSLGTMLRFVDAGSGILVSAPDVTVAGFSLMGASVGQAIHASAGADRLRLRNLTVLGGWGVANIQDAGDVLVQSALAWSPADVAVHLTNVRGALVDDTFAASGFREPNGLAPGVVAVSQSQGVVINQTGREGGTTQESEGAAALLFEDSQDLFVNQCLVDTTNGVGLRLRGVERVTISQFVSSLAAHAGIDVERTTTLRAANTALFGRRDVAAYPVRPGNNGVRVQDADGIIFVNTLTSGVPPWTDGGISVWQADAGTLFQVFRALP